MQGSIQRYVGISVRLVQESVAAIMVSGRANRTRSPTTTRCGAASPNSRQTASMPSGFLVVCRTTRTPRTVSILFAMWPCLSSALPAWLENRTHLSPKVPRQLSQAADNFGHNLSSYGKVRQLSLSKTMPCCGALIYRPQQINKDQPSQTETEYQHSLSTLKRNHPPSLAIRLFDALLSVLCCSALSFFRFVLSSSVFLILLCSSSFPKSDCFYTAI